MRKNGIVAVALVALMTMAFSGMVTAESDNAGGNGAGGENGNGDRPDNPGSFMLNQSVLFGERVVTEGANTVIYMDGSLLDISEDYYNADFPKYLPMYSEDVSVQADWSDNIVLHNWDAGDKIRTEVILQKIVDPSIAVFTIGASFTIEHFNVDESAYEEVWSGTTAEGLWTDGPTDAYSAEVNQLGMLLYGFNWDSSGCDPGKYKLTFSLGDQPYENYPDLESPLVGIAYNTIAIDAMVDPDMYGDDENYCLVGAGLTGSSTWVEIILQ